MGVVALLLILLSPAMSYRLSSRQGVKKPSTHYNSQNQQNQSHNASRKSATPWPPRIPMWSFLPSSHNHPNSVTNDDNASPLQKPSKRDSSSRGMSLSLVDEGLAPEIIPLEDGEEEEFIDEPWLVSLKRSTNSGQRSSGGLKRNRIYDVPQIGKQKYSLLSSQMPIEFHAFSTRSRLNLHEMSNSFREKIVPGINHIKVE